MKDFQVYTKEQLKEFVKGRKAGKYELCKQIDGCTYTIYQKETPSPDAAYIDRDITFTYVVNFNKNVSFIIDDYLKWQQMVLEEIVFNAPRCSILSLTEEQRKTIEELEPDRKLDSYKELFHGWDTKFRFWHGITEIKRDGTVGDTLTEDVIFLEGSGWLDILYIEIAESQSRHPNRVAIELEVGDGPPKVRFNNMARIIITSSEERSTMSFYRVEVTTENQEDIFMKIKIARAIFNQLPVFITNPIFKLKEIMECL